MARSDTLKFLAAFLRHPGKVGAIAPSSRALAAEMVRGITLKPGEAIVEFGPGTGPFTAAIRELLPSDRDPKNCYLGIEREPKFVTVLRERFSDMPVVEASAEDAPKLAREAGLGRVRAILCGLPFASLPPITQDGVINAIDKLLEPGSEFRTFQYVHAYPLPTAIRYRRRMASIFGPHETSKPVLPNLPPAYVLTWRQ